MTQIREKLDLAPQIRGRRLPTRWTGQKRIGRTVGMKDAAPLRVGRSRTAGVLQGGSSRTTTGRPPVAGRCSRAGRDGARGAWRGGARHGGKPERTGAGAGAGWGHAVAARPPVGGHGRRRSQLRAGAASWVRATIGELRCGGGRMNRGIEGESRERFPFECFRKGQASERGCGNAGGRTTHLRENVAPKRCPLFSLFSCERYTLYSWLPWKLL